ncbi:uncharacterized protein LOC135212256 [Macrobrachium nipponense]|uniref:uncharacterized protein LOC135212256 n=1 Tax=Macrobrachium nipponense TaxID=159736 RepID=UPI0030C7F01B
MNVTKRDEGEYECQMSTHPHVSIFTYLKVQNAYSRVEGPEERVVASGSDLRLVCIIEGASSKPSYVFWYHYERMVNYDAARGITVTQTSPMRSTLAISEVTADHAGNYTCQPSNAVPASVNVHVVAETTEPSATGRVGKKVAEKTPVRQLGVKSASSGGSCPVPSKVPFAFLSFLVLHGLVVPGLLALSTQAVEATSLVVLKFTESPTTSKTDQPPSDCRHGFQPSLDLKRKELALPHSLSYDCCRSCCCCLMGAQSLSGLPE